MIPWREKVPLLSIHPEMAIADDIAKLASEYMEANYLLIETLKWMKMYDNGTNKQAERFVEKIVAHIRKAQGIDINMNIPSSGKE